jgi:hypothetical protein
VAAGQSALWEDRSGNLLSESSRDDRYLVGDSRQRGTLGLASGLHCYLARGLASDFEQEDDICDGSLRCRDRSDAGPEFAIKDFVPLL